MLANGLYISEFTEWQMRVPIDWGGPRRCGVIFYQRVYFSSEEYSDRICGDKTHFLSCGGGDPIGFHADMIVNPNGSYNWDVGMGGLDS